jgi:hypothetical protein
MSKDIKEVSPDADASLNERIARFREHLESRIGGVAIKFGPGELENEL